MSLLSNDLAATEGEVRNSTATEERRLAKDGAALSATLAEAVTTASHRSKPAPAPLGPQ